MIADPHKNTLLQVAQGNALTKTCKRVFLFPTQEKLKNKKFPSLQKNKTSQTHSANLTQTSIEWWTALKNIYCNLTRHYFGQTEAHAGNKGLKEMAGTVVNQTFVHLINSCGRRTVCASKSATSLSPEPLPASI